MKTATLIVYFLFEILLGYGQTARESKFNDSLAVQLDSIYFNDQKIRLIIDSMGIKADWQSNQMQSLLREMLVQDSANLISVKLILDKYGWLGPKVVGNQGNKAIFLVIQHADNLTQEKYLPMMREAVKIGNASGNSLALLEDRVALNQGKKQIYGSQIAMYFDTNKYYVSPLFDPDNVDKRRAVVGLQPIAIYLKKWGIDWDVEQYKKELPQIEAKEKERNK